MKIKIVRAIVFLLFFINLVSCDKFSKSSSLKTIISGKIDPAFCRDKKVYFYQFTDSLSLFLCEKKATDSCLINDDGSFHMEISNWKQAGFFDLGTSELVFARHYFLAPGDQLKLIFNGKEMPLMLANYKEIGNYNKFLQLFNDTFFREPSAKRTYFVLSNFMLAPDYAVFINDRKSKQLAFYENYFKGGEIDSTFDFYFRNELTYNWANDKVYFLWKKRTRQEFVPLDTSYYDFIQETNTDNAKALICPGYTRYIGLYLSELYQQDLPNLPLGYPQSLHICLNAKKMLSGTGQKIAFYQLLKEELSGVKAIESKQSKSLLDSLTRIAYNSCQDSGLFKFVEQHHSNAH